MVEAKAVRKAVTSSALIRPVVFPKLSMMVRDPLMLEVLVPSFDEMEVWPVPMLSAETLAGTEDEPVRDVSVLLLLMVEIDSLWLEAELSFDLRDRLSTAAGSPVESGGRMLTTLTPWPVMPLAGMKSVVLPSLRFK